MGHAMPRIPDDVKPKLAALLRLQSSDNDGERANASAAITRILKNCGCDWHDLTEMLMANKPARPFKDPFDSWSPPPPPPPKQPKPRQKPQPQTEDIPGADELSSEELTDMLDTIENGSLNLSSASQGFVESMRDRAARYDTVFLSGKQMKWLKDLFERAGG